MSNDNDGKVTSIFKNPKPSPVAICWGPNYDQMERAGVSALYINAFKLQTNELEKVKDERDLLRHAYADLADKAQSLDQEISFANVEIARLNRRLYEEQQLTQALAARLEHARVELNRALDEASRE